MSNQGSTREGCAGWFKWIVGSFIALLGAGGGLAAWSGAFGDSTPQQNPDPIVITINSDDGGAGAVAPALDEAVIRLPDDVYVPAVIPTPMPIPTRQNVNRPSEQDVAEFLYEAVLAETAAYLYLDSSYVSYYFTGGTLRFMESEIDQLLNDGVVVAKLYDESRSYIHNIDFVSDNRIDVDSCEIWSQEYYNFLDSSFLGGEGPTLYPQTITIEQFTDGWYITDVVFYEVPAFCN